MTQPTPGGTGGAVGTAVAPDDPVARGLRQRDQMRAVQKAIRNKQWGKDLEERTIQAVVMWCEKRGIDVATEVSVLGGNIYLEADYYLRRLAQKIGEGKVRYARPDHVHYDERLEKLMNDEKAPEDVRIDARAEHYRRIVERAKHNLSDKALAACVFRIGLADVEGEFTGAKQAGGVRGKTSSGAFKDPIAEEFPMETVESRAARRACRYIIDTFPDLRAEMDVIEAEAKLISVELRGDRTAARQGSMLQYPQGEAPIRDGVDLYEEPARGDLDEHPLEPDERTGGWSSSHAREPIAGGLGQKITELERKQLYAAIESKDVSTLSDLGDTAALHALLRQIRNAPVHEQVFVDTDMTLGEWQEMMRRILALPNHPHPEEK